MPSRILLISANRCETPDPVFPLGLACLNSALRRAGHECRWHDRLIDGTDLGESLRRWKPDFVGISLRNIDDVLIRRRETFFEDLSALTSAVKTRAGCPVILGGSGFSVFPKRLLELSGADYGIAGEGEVSLVRLIAALEGSALAREIPGLVYREGGRIQANPMQAGPDQPGLETTDRPDRITAHYLSAGGMLNLQTQRGCAFQCCYCTYPVIEGRAHRRRSPESIAADFEKLHHLGARYAVVVDSVFNSSPRHVTETCEALVRSGNKLPWGCFLRPQGLSAELMRLMRRAGLAHIEFGSDSFCDEVLTEYSKGFTFDDILQSSELARKEDIDFCHFLIAGGPGETPKTIERGFANSASLKEAVIMAVVGMRIYPGTDLSERAGTEGQISRETDLLSPTYYLAPGLTETEVFQQLNEFSGRSPNWIAGDPEPSYRDFVARLRRRGVVGPLWSYFSLLQRLGGVKTLSRMGRTAGRSEAGPH
ncbi:MAG: lipid biosynthesis B12-binding/radical SAM protein [Limisphaerales bacterium]